MECYKNELVELIFTAAFFLAGGLFATISNYIMEKYLKFDKKKIASAGRYIAMYALGWISAMIMYDYIYFKI